LIKSERKGLYYDTQVSSECSIHLAMLEKNVSVSTKISSNTDITLIMINDFLKG